MPFGVDLGTTNSSVAWADPAGEVYSLKVRRGPKEPFDAVERSLVLDPLGVAPIVGHLAEGAPRRNGDTPLVSSFKRRFDKARLRQLRYELITTPTSEYDPVDQCIRFETTERRVPVFYDEYSLDEVTQAAALVFERLLTSTEIDPDAPSSSPSAQRSVLSRLLGRRASDGQTSTNPSTPTAVDSEPGELLYVGLPVSFGPTARRRLLRSLVASGCFGRGEDAYRNVLARCRLVYEPLALISTLTLLESQNVFVVDYGGGTLDLAYLHVDLDGMGRRVKELALGGLPTAGDHLDDLFRERLLEANPALRRSFDQQVAAGPEDRYRAYSAFSRAKVELSTRESTLMRLFGDVEVRRAELERAVGAELDGMAAAVAETLTRAGARTTDVGTVFLTGGSSLIPAVQDRLRSLFPHLSDELAFDAGTPGDVESERRTLTGVSRGLARFGFLESFEAGAPCAFSVLIPDTPVTRAVCLERGAPDVFDLAESRPVKIRVRPGRRSVAVYSDLLRETYCGAVADIDLPSEIEIRLSASRDRFAPAFVVSRADTGKELGRFDLDGMSLDALDSWVRGDAEWMPVNHTHVESMFLTRPLEVGDFVEWKANGRFRRGKVIDMREIASGRMVEVRMAGFDPEPYAIRVAVEEAGVVKIGQVAQHAWRIGDIRLA
jgi:hypothetical protein